jgi:twinfilin-like protein
MTVTTELLVHEESIKSQNNKLDDDLALLQNELKDDVPAYILARLDDTPSAWWAISFVPDHAKVRDKVLNTIYPTMHCYTH